MKSEDNRLGFQEVEDLEDRIVAMFPMGGRIYIATEHKVYVMPKPKKKKKKDAKK